MTDHLSGPASLAKALGDRTEEVAKLHARLTHISFVITGNDHALIDCSSAEVDECIKNFMLRVVEDKLGGDL
jgi:hypothetical protein